MKHKLSNFVMLILLGFLILLSLSNLGLCKERVKVDLKLGFDGYYKKKSWLPAVIKIQNYEFHIIGKVIISVATQKWYMKEPMILRSYSKPLNMQPFEKKTISIPIRISEDTKFAILSIVSHNNIIFTKDVDLKPIGYSILTLVLTSNPDDFNILSTLKLPNKKEIKTSFPKLKFLPKKWIYYQ
jgi:hypothetical protein